MMSVAISILKLFIKPDDKLILFNSYAGRKYDDSPKAIYEAMRHDPRFKGYHFVWAFHNSEQHNVKGAKKIKTDCLDYFMTALMARVWVTNSSVERGLSFKRRSTLYFNTWHGTPMKKMGTDINDGNQSFQSKGKNNFDVMMSQGDFDTEIFSRSFNIPKERFLKVGLPRNDILAAYTSKQRKDIRCKLGIKEEQKVILYCPTFREYEKDENFGVVMAPPMDLRKWQSKLGSDYVLLMRAHYEVSKVMNIDENEFVKDMTDYPDLNELLIAADILISDYSSVYFDYSITGKPILHFTYDYEKYSRERGMYIDIRNYFNGSANEDDLIRIIKEMNEQKEKNRTIRFRSKFVNHYGNATIKAVNCIAKHIL